MSWNPYKKIEKKAQEGGILASLVTEIKRLIEEGSPKLRQAIIEALAQKGRPVEDVVFDVIGGDFVLEGGYDEYLDEILEGLGIDRYDAKLLIYGLEY